MTQTSRKRFPEVTVEADGKSYTLVLDINAMRSVEALLSTPDKDVTFQDVAQRAVRGSVSAVTALMWAALRRHHKDMTMDATGDLISAIDQDALTSQMGQLMSTTQPDEADTHALGVRPSRPRVARAS